MAEEPEEAKTPELLEGGWEPFYPHHVIKQMVQILCVLLVLIGLATFLPAPMLEKADPFSTPEHIKPEWYFLAQYQFLKVAEALSILGAWAPKVIGVLAQGLAVLLVFAVPFLDRGKDRRPLKRRKWLGIGICVAIIFIVFTIWGHFS